MKTSLLDNPILLPSTPWRKSEHRSPSFKPSFPFNLMCQLFSIKGTNVCPPQSLSDSLSAYPLTTPREGKVYAWPKYSMGVLQRQSRREKNYIFLKKLESHVEDRACSDFGWHQSKHTHWLHLTVASWLVHWCYWTGLKHKETLGELAPHIVTPASPWSFSQRKKARKSTHH